MERTGTRMTKAQLALMARVEIMEARALARPHAVRGALLIGSAEHAAARALARRGEIVIVRGMAGGCVPTLHARPIVSVAVWA